MSNFNIEMIVIDNAGFQFIDSCNENKLFMDSKIDMKFFNFDSDAEGADYDKALKKSRQEYNKEDKKICFKQVFTTDWIRRANEHLQARIDHKRIWFASRVQSDGEAFNKYSNVNVTLNNIGEPSLLDFIEAQDALVYQTKRQCALVEVTSTARGHQTFDLPLHLRKSSSANRARKDNYTTLMLANWGIKCYYDMMAAPAEEQETFVPRML
jgi:hypothetical protein